MFRPLSYVSRSIFEVSAQQPIIQIRNYVAKRKLVKKKWFVFTKRMQPRYKGNPNPRWVNVTFFHSKGKKMIYSMCLCVMYFTPLVSFYTPCCHGYRKRPVTWSELKCWIHSKSTNSYGRLWTSLILVQYLLTRLTFTYSK